MGRRSRPLKIAALKLEARISYALGRSDATPNVITRRFVDFSSSQDASLYVWDQCARLAEDGKLQF